MRYESELLRPSIFDTLKEKHPERAEDPGTRPRPKRSRRRPPMLRPVGRSPRSTARLVAAIVFLFVAGGLGLLSFYPRPVEPPAERPADEVSRSEPAGAQIVPPAEERPTTGTAEPERLAALEAPAARPRPAFEEPRPAPAEPPAPPREAPEPAEPASAAEVTDSAQEDAAAERRPAVKVVSATPDYPEAARLAGLAGTVVVEAEIDPTGAVSSTRVLRGVSPELDEAAREAVGRWRFEPATSGGRPTTDVYRTAIHFELEPPEPETEVASVPGKDDFEPPVRLYAPPPSYPPADWVAAVEGDVVVRAAISETGKVTGVEVLQGLTAGLNMAAIEALERWRFRPAMRQGEAVASNQVLTFRFAR